MVIPNGKDELENYFWLKLSFFYLSSLIIIIYNYITPLKKNRFYINKKKYYDT